MGERKQGSSEAVKGSKPVTGRSARRKASSKRAVSGVPKDLASDAGKKEPRRAAPKIGVKKEKNLAKKPGPGSETPPMAEEKSKIMAEPSENQAERGNILRCRGTQNQRGFLYMPLQHSPRPGRRRPAGA